MKKLLYLGVYLFFFIMLLIDGVGFWSALLWPVAVIGIMFFAVLLNFR